MVGMNLITDDRGKQILIIDVDMHKAMVTEILTKAGLSLDRLDAPAEKKETSSEKHLSKKEKKRMLGTERADAVRTIISELNEFIGTPHKLGGHSKTGIDCSGLAYEAFKAVGIKIPRTTAELQHEGVGVNKDALQPGDLVFFATGLPGKLNHVGVVTDSMDTEDIKFIHASSSRGVIESSLAPGYWADVYLGAKRILH